MRVCLHILVSPQAPVPFEHGGPAIAIGRDPGCELPLAGNASPGVSWRHACITLTAERAYVSDLDSSNGTFLNDRRVEGRRPLRVGDYIRLGQAGPTLQVLELDLRPASPRQLPPTAPEDPLPGIAGPEPPRREPARAGGGQPADRIAPRPRAFGQRGPVAAPVQPEGRPEADLPRQGPSTTRRLLLTMQAGQRRVWVIAGAVAVGMIVLLGGLLLVLEGRLGQVSDQASELTANASDLKGQVAELDGKTANLKKQVVETSKGTAVLKGEVVGLRDKVAQVDGRVSGVGEKVAAVQGQVAGLNDKTTRLEGQVGDLKGKLSERAPPMEPGPSFTALYKQVLRSTAWICVARARGLQPSGTGVLVDRERKLVLTAYHVVAVGGQVRVFFPSFDSSGKAIAEPMYYLQRGTSIRGRVIVGDRRRDLAVVELDWVPPDVPALPLAAGSPEPAERIHTIGNPGASQALWVYTKGSVRQVYRKKMRATTPDFRVQEIDAWMVETQSPVNPGDSGGPVFNDRGELVAITSSFAVGARLMSYCVDLRELQAVLSRYRP